MTESSALARTQSSVREGGRTGLIGLVRNLSRGGRGKDNRQTGSKYGSGGEIGSTAISTSSNGYKLVTPNRAPSSTYSPASPHRPNKERIIWGPPPANVNGFTSREVEGVELVDDGPIIIDTSSPVQSKSKGRHGRQAQNLSPPRHAVSPPPISRNVSATEVTRPSPTLSKRRSIDTLISSLDFVPRLEPDLKRSSTVGRTNSRRPVAGYKTSGHTKMNSITSTARAKPATESPIPVNQTSPFHGYWPAVRSSNDEIVDDDGDDEINKIKERLRGFDSVWTVSRGWKKGIFSSFEEAEQQTRGFPGPIIRQFATVDEAVQFLKSSSSNPMSLANVEDYSSTGARFGARSQEHVLQRQLSGQILPADDAKKPLKSVERNPFRSPKTNPFLPESDEQSDRVNSLDAYTSKGAGNSPFLRSTQKQYATSGLDQDYAPLLPPPAIGHFDKVTTHSKVNPTSSSQVVGSIMPIVLCQDIECSVEFYRTIFDLKVAQDQRQHGQVSMAHQDTSRPCLLIRSHTPSPASSSLKTSVVSSTMYRSCIALEQGHCDLEQLHATMTRRVADFQSHPQLPTAPRSSQSEVRVEEMEWKPWGSLEFNVIDLDGNMVAVRAS
ncbi:hypothetical protein CBS101457_001019 [Exobasidium rhododendri]|nr:hypothetical protein CBS101457_001019 [Exobasidium rhododendri]